MSYVVKINQEFERLPKFVTIANSSIIFEPVDEDIGIYKA